MHTMSTTYLEPEAAMVAFAFTAVLYLIISLIVVLLVRSVSAKLLLLGILTALTGITFAALIPSVAILAFVLVILASILVLTGLLAALIGYVFQLAGSTKSQGGNPPAARL